MLKIFVEFYDKSNGGVTVAWDESDIREGDATEQQLTETLLFACFTIRQLRNMGNHPATKALAWELSEWNPPGAADMHDPGDKPVVALPQHVIFKAALDMGIDYRSVKKKYGNPLMLVAYRGSGKRSFVGKMHLTEHKPTFFLELKGFGIGGILGIGIPQYATDSVFLLLTYLALRHSDTPDYANKIQAVAASCAQVYNLGRISTMNQENLAVSIVNEQFFGTT